jgi:transposase
MRAALLSGAFQSDVAARFGVSRQRVSQIAVALRRKGHCLAKPAPGTKTLAALLDRKSRVLFREENRATIRRLRAEGCSIREIAELTGFGRGFVSHYCHTYQVCRGLPDGSEATTIGDSGMNPLQNQAGKP